MNSDSAQAHSPQSEPHASHGAHHNHVRDLFVIYFWLMVLLALTVITALWPKLNFGSFNIVIAMAIAVTKAAMVVWIFMHVKYGGRLVWVAASAAFVWLAIMFLITFADYATRGRLSRGEPIPTHPLENVQSHENVVPHEGEKNQQRD